MLLKLRKELLCVYVNSDNNNKCTQDNKGGILNVDF